MGKGDKKTKRGKIIKGSYGVRRPKKKNINKAVVEEVFKKKKVAVKAEEKPKAKTKKIAYSSVVIAAIFVFVPTLSMLLTRTGSLNFLSFFAETAPPKAPRRVIPCHLLQFGFQTDQYITNNSLFPSRR